MSSSLTARLSGTAQRRRHVHARDFIDVSYKSLFIDLTIAFSDCYHRSVR